jgi:ferric iron reductase protein FhuF
MLEMLRPFFQGAWQPYGESLALAEAPQTRPSIAHWLLQPGALNKVLTQHAELLRAPQVMRAVASDWSIRYVGALLPPIVAAASLVKRCLPLDWDEMVLHLDRHGTPGRFEISHLGTACAHAATAERYETLVWEHLDPLLKRLGREARVPTKILWGNVHRALNNIFAGALELLKHQPTCVQTLTVDRDQLLAAPTWPDSRRNPLALRPRLAAPPASPSAARRAATTAAGSSANSERAVLLHATCCLAYELPQTGFCEACPLAPQHRRRRTAVSKDVPGWIPG